MLGKGASLLLRSHHVSGNRNVNRGTTEEQTTRTGRLSNSASANNKHSLVLLISIAEVKVSHLVT